MSSASALPNSFKASAIDSAVDRASRNGCFRIGSYMLSFLIFCSEMQGKSFNHGILLYIRFALYQVLSRTIICVFLFTFRFLYASIDVAWPFSLGHNKTISYSLFSSSVTATDVRGTSSLVTDNAFGHEQSRQTTSQFSTMFLAMWADPSFLLNSSLSCKIETCKPSLRTIFSLECVFSNKTLSHNLHMQRFSFLKHE